MARRQVDLNFKWQSDFCMNTLEYQGHFSEVRWQDIEKEQQQNCHYVPAHSYFPGRCSLRH